jgi:hypothetical protein
VLYHAAGRAVPDTNYWSLFNIKGERTSHQLNFIFYILEILKSFIDFCGMHPVVCQQSFSELLFCRLTHYTCLPFVFRDFST